MRKSLLTLSLLSFLGYTNAQTLVTFIGDKSYVKVAEGGLLSTSGLDVDVKESGILDVSGNVIMKGDIGKKFTTRSSTTGNVILRMKDDNSYGQLYITGFAQNNLTANISKEYRADSHGTYQQIGLPFYNKPTGSLSSELHKTFTNQRWTQNEILKWNNNRVVSDNFNTSSMLGVGGISKRYDYFMLGALGMTIGTNTFTESNPNSTINPYLTGYTAGRFVLNGFPYADGGEMPILQNAGKNENFGSTGANTNYYGEYYNSYVQDQILGASSTPWQQPNYGRNIYQFGNPYFTNLDLNEITFEPSSGGDGNVIPNVLGVRINPGVVKTDANGATYSTTAQFVTYVNGLPPAGDVDKLIIKPLQTFVIKLDTNTGVGNYELNFDTLRRFKNTARSYGTNYSVEANKMSGTLKQLGVIALDAQGNELGRCYYVVHPNAITGAPNGARTLQATNSGANVIGTYEENTSGGYDVDMSNYYWLYINEANENDFSKKAVPLDLYSGDIKSLKFELRENASLLDDGVSNLSTGKAFYIQKNGSSDYITIQQGGIIPVDGSQYNLFYDKGSNVTLDTNDSKLSRTRITFNPSTDRYVLLFDPKWNHADVKVYDASGKLILTKSNVTTKQNLELEIQKLNGVYVVVATSEKGDVFNGKIIR